MNHKLIRITTIPLSLEKLLENQLKFMKRFFEVTAVSSDDQRLQEFGNKQGVDTFHVDLTRQITPIKDLKAVVELYKFLKKEKPSIVHTHTPKAGIVGMLASTIRKCTYSDAYGCGASFNGVVWYEEKCFDYRRKINLLLVPQTYILIVKA